MRPGPGRPEPLGVTPGEGGANVALFSAGAERVELCLFDPAGRETRLTLPDRTGPVWHGAVPGLAPGTPYGFRVHGPWAPEAGLRFNPAKLLLDPHARALTGRLAAPGEALGHAGTDDRVRDGRDSAPHVARAVVAALPPAIDPGERPRRDWRETVILEAHAKSLTRLMPGLGAEAGTFDALAAAPLLAHLRALGVTALELLPVQAWVDERRLTALGLSNHWGYNPVAFLVPEPRLCGPGGPAALRRAVQRLHAEGIEVILDICLNHSGEGDELGPTLAFRGLDNAAYYRLAPDPRFYDNPTGCGNALDLQRPAMLRLALDALRFWAERVGVDGFRFDLGTSLGRGPDGFDAEAPFLQALMQDPVLRDLKLIAEPWDIGPGGYRLGAFPAVFAEWNDRFRDSARRFWRGDPAAPALASGLLGSAEVFDRAGRPATASVNFVTAHDGFTLADLTRYRQRRNEANGEGNRDGHGENWSDDFGAEGPDPALVAPRARRMRSLLATLLLAQGVPMLRAGDEIGQSQGGNNNAYAQDNAVSWIDWADADRDLLAFAGAAVAFRARHPALRQRGFLHGAARPADGSPDAEWRAASGGPPAWDDPGLAFLGLVVRDRAGGDAVFLALNAGAETAVVLPDPPPGHRWRRALDTGPAEGLLIAAGSLVAFEPEPAP